MRAAEAPRARPPASVAVIIAVAVGALCLAACAGPSAAGNANAQVSQVGGPQQTSATYPGALLFAHSYPKPDVTLTDTSGAPYDIAADTGGRVTLVYFGYTHCPDLCPLNMFTAANAIGDLPVADRSRVSVVFVTTDPDRDTPTVIRTWLDHFDDAFIGLTGTITQIRQAEALTGLPLSFAEHSTEAGGSYTVVHAGYVLVYTQDDRSHLEFPAEITPSQEAHDLATLLQHGWQA
jgi:protein SCO1/2